MLSSAPLPTSRKRSAAPRVASAIRCAACSAASLASRTVSAGRPSPPRSSLGAWLNALASDDSRESSLASSLAAFSAAVRTAAFTAALPASPILRAASPAFCTASRAVSAASRRASAASLRDGSGAGAACSALGSVAGSGAQAVARKEAARAKSRRDAVMTGRGADSKATACRLRNPAAKKNRKMHAATAGKQWGPNGPHCFHHDRTAYLTRFLYSSVRVSISILSPISTKAGTGSSKPVPMRAGFMTLPEVSPLTAGSV